MKESWYLSSTPDPEVVETPEPLESKNSDEVQESDLKVNVGLGKALATYRKLAEGGKDAEPLSEKQEEDLVNRLTEIENREIIDSVVEHEPIEIPCEKGKITIGPPKLTRSSSCFSDSGSASLPPSANFR